jgi:alpha-beta hydrolase superfamily lysophospholipase
MSFDHRLFDTPSGARLALRILDPQTELRGIVQIHHGLSEHGARYRGFAEALSKAGFAVAVADHRGHGWTQSEDSSAGLFAKRDGWKHVIEDAMAVEDHMRNQYRGVPYLVFGHSMGGVIAMNQALSRPGEIDGLAIWNSNLAMGSNAGLMRFVLGIERMFKGQYGLSTWIDALTFKTWGKKVKGGKGGADWLSRIPEEVMAYEADPKCGQPATISLWYDFLRLVERGSDETRYRAMSRDLPIHLVAGGEDPATDKGDAVKTLATRFRALEFTDITFRFDPEARHETLNDLGRETAIDDFIAWASRITWPETADALFSR